MRAQASSKALDARAAIREYETRAGEWDGRDDTFPARAPAEERVVACIVGVA